jgi:hypothetical protein
MNPQKFKQLVDQHYIIKEPVSVQGGVASTNACLIPKKSQPCDDCGIMVQARVEIYLKRRLDSDNPYWIKKCSECNYKIRVARPFDTTFN